MGFRGLGFRRNLSYEHFQTTEETMISEGCLEFRAAFGDKPRA